MNVRLVSIAITLLVSLLVAACAIETSTEQVTALPNFVAPTAVVPSTATPVLPTEVPTPAAPPTVTPIPPTATPRQITPPPTPTVVDDGTPVVIKSDDGWVITEGEIASMMTFIEETHLLEFTDPVEVRVSDDIGAGRAAGFEIFSERDWYLLRGLGLADTQAGRDEANQVRRDRIRGVCCRFDGITSVAVEIQPTKLGTELIVVHELTHALHTQHPELFRNTSRDTTESPAPFAAAVEGVPQFVTFEYLALAPLDERLEVVGDLPIIRDDMLNLIDVGPARFLNFAYATGPNFVEAVVAAQGLEGLSDLIGEPPTTTEQVLFPDKYLTKEIAGAVAPPSLPPGAQQRASGTIGAAMLMFLLTDTQGELTAKQQVQPWNGDQYIVYEMDEQLCLAANIAMDGLGSQIIFSEQLADSLRPTFPAVETAVFLDMFSINTCGLETS